MKKTIIKTTEQINNVRESGKYLNELLLLTMENIKPGVALIELENIAENYIKKMGVKGAFKGYGGFPANLCLSVNDCVVHGIPDDYELKPGDLLKVDAGITYKSAISDSAVSVIVGGDQNNEIGANLISSTKNALDSSLHLIGPGKNVYDFSLSIYNHLKQDGFEVLRYLTGHGVGVGVHEGPYIYNYPFPEGKDILFKKGMVIALEPITALKSTEFIEKPGNSWNLYTKKGDLGAQWEYTVTVNDNGIEVLSGIV